MSDLKLLRLTDSCPPCLDTIIEFAPEGNVQIITDDDESDTFTITVESADKMIDWLTKWKRNALEGK